MAVQTDVLVIGAGPGGYVAAIRLAQLGKKVVIAEKDKLGGECLNYGCIPSKALIDSANLVWKATHAANRGIEVEGLRVDLPRLQAWKEGVVTTLRNGIEKLLSGNGITVLYGPAKFVDPHTVEVATAQGVETVLAGAILLAVGGHPVSLPGFAFDGKLILSTKEVLELRTLPQDLLIIGGGISGLEIGMMYRKLGSRVVFVELLDQLLPGIDPSIVAVITRSLRELGITYHVKSRAKGWTMVGDRAKIEVQTETGEIVSYEADAILVSVGRVPTTREMALEKAGVALDEKGFIRADRQLRTSVPHIYAIGDATGQPYLAHRASKEGLIAAEVIAGGPGSLDYQALPSAIFTDPEIALVGLTETEAKEKGKKVVVGKFPFAANGRALTTGESQGFVRVVAEEGTDRILGVQIVGPEASNLISEAALAIEMGATVEDLALTIHPHPTLPEALAEAAEATKGKAIHILQK